MNNMWGSMAQYNTMYWSWPIAIYLFLAGLSAGCAIVAVIVKNMKNSNTVTNLDPTVKIGALIAPIAICCGLLLLIYDLGRFWNFYMLLIKYNFHSVMSIGVLCLIMYSIFSILFAIVIYENEIRKYSILKPLIFIVNILKSISPASKILEYIFVILSICVAAYTGFLLSAIGKIPLWNTPILPILFLFSGFSSGIAITIFFGVILFSKKINKTSIHYLLSLDLKVIIFEIIIIFILFVGMYFQGGNSAVMASKSLTDGFYGYIFWVGVIFIGLILPVLIALTALKNHAYKPKYIIINSCVVLVGVVLLRFYIVYAGQLV